MVTLLLA